jgi:ABC-type uncharacterized transport system substrate-binding protein
MKRRHFITLVGGAVAAWPLAVRAQQAERGRRVGVLFGLSQSDPNTPRNVTAFKQELARLGWVEGRNLQIDFRFAVGLETAQAAVSELVRLAPGVIYVWGGATTRAAQQETQTIPIVFTGPSTPVENVNVARPQGNITGFPFLYPSIAGKWVELLKEADPRVTRIGVVVSPETRIGTSGYIPYPAEGGLMSYASNFEDLHRRAAGYVDRLLRGAKVNEVPIERPTRFELIVNLKAAKAIGLTLPPLLVTRADQVIE